MLNMFEAELFLARTIFQMSLKKIKLKLVSVLSEQMDLLYNNILANIKLDNTEREQPLEKYSVCMSKTIYS